MKSLPRKSWAYPLYDLVLIGWMFGGGPLVVQIIVGRLHIAAMGLGALLALSAVAVVVGRRDGISVSDYARTR